MALANQETIPQTLPALTHSEAVARLATILAAMIALDYQTGRCTDPTAESCLLTLRVEREIEYLETLYGWEYEASDVAATH
jgi:hypothetical protein